MRPRPKWLGESYDAPAWAFLDQSGPLWADLSLPRLWTQARRLWALANVALAPEPLVLGAVQRFGRLTLGAAAVTCLGTPFAHEHETPPALLLEDGGPTAVFRLARAAWAVARARGRGGSGLVGYEAPLTLADFEPSPPREEGDVILMDSVKNAPYALFDWYVDPYEGPNYGRRASFFYNEFSRALPHFLTPPRARRPSGRTGGPRQKALRWTPPPSPP